jgi:hypothetical protein
LTGEDATLGVAPPQGIIEQRWLVFGGSGGYEHQWNRTNVTRVQYDGRSMRPVEGSGFESDTEMIWVDQLWNRTAAFSMIGRYRVSQTRQRSSDIPTEPIRHQNAELALRYQRRLSPTRSYALSLRGGATHVFDVAADEVKSVHPSFGGGVELEVSRTWSLSAAVRRDVSVLGGVSVVPVLTDGVDLVLSGTPTRKLRFAVFGSIATSSTLMIGTEHVMDVGGATAEVRYAITPWSATFVSYGFYRHRIEDPFLVADGFPTRYERRAIRVGMTLWLPLYGAF